MVVLVLIGILTGLIVAEMKGTFEDALLRSTSRQLVSVFHLAYSLSVSLNQLNRFRLDVKAGRYLIERRVREEERGSGFVPVREIPGSEGKLDARIAIEIRKADKDLANAPDEGAPLVAAEDSRVEDHGDAIAFYPDGTADAGEIVLRDRDGFRRALRINPITARVHIAELERE
jgi:Tfp pilus assembly protein FimT